MQLFTIWHGTIKNSRIVCFLKSGISLKLKFSAEINGSGMEIDKLHEHFSFLERQHWDVPDDLRLIRTEAETKETDLKKTMEGKLTLEELIKLADDASKEKIKTQTMKLILEQCERAKRWIENAEDTKDKWVSIKTLQRMVNDSKTLQITSPYIEEVKMRYDKAHDWYNFYIIIV